MTAAKVQARREEAPASEVIWRALASPHRRALLDLLRDGPRTTGELAAAMPDLSRFAVMQHLAVLVEAGLVLVRRKGRERFNHLNAVPLRRVYERWVAGFADRAAGAALALGRYVEREGETMSRTVSIENEIALKAPTERVFRALSEEQHRWYPHSYGGERLRSVVFEPRVGGACYEDWGDGTGHLYGHVWHYDPPVAFTLRGYLRPAVNLEHVYTIEPTDEGCILRQSMVAYGDITDDAADQIRYHGDLTRVESSLRDWVERQVAVSG